MFTGIVEETGGVVAFDGTGGKWRLVVRAARCAEDVKIGDSVAVDGCCLTVVSRHGRRGARELGFDVLEETRMLTNLRFAVPGRRVNLERALAAGDRFGGHFVTGHIDGVGLIQSFEPSGEDHYLEIKTSREILRHIVYKGSICVDGVSLTIAQVAKNCFGVWIIPHTLKVTSLSSKKIGDAVNLEADLLSKYVDRLLCARRRSRMKE